MTRLTCWVLLVPGNIAEEIQDDYTAVDTGSIELNRVALGAKWSIPATYY
jgi:hypothetical protein